MKNLSHFRHALSFNAKYALFIIVALVASCSDDEPGFTRIDENYCTKTLLDCETYTLALQIGDYWIDDKGSKTMVTGTTVLDSKNYFESSWYETATSETAEDFWYERYESEKWFVLNNEAIGEELWADFSVDVDDEWETPNPGGGTQTITLETKTGTTTINGISFSDAYVFGTTYSDYPDDYVQQTFLPGINLIEQKYYVNGILQDDYSFKIVEFKFGGKVYKIGK